MKVKKLPSREPTPIAKGLEKLETLDFLYLVCNQVVEFVFRGGG